MRDMNKQVKMLCSICGNDQFSAIDDSIEDLFGAQDETEIKCSDCGRVVTKAQLIEENAEVIDGNVEEFKKEIMKEFKKDIGKMFR